MKPYYSEAGITIYHGDARDILPSLLRASENTKTLLCTDPPYGIKFASSPTKWSRDNISRDKQSWDDYAPDLTPFLDVAWRSMIWGGNHFQLPVSRGWLAWIKPPGLPSYGDMELCWTDIEMPCRHLFCERCQNKEKTDHPTQKPLKLIKWCLGFDRECSLILDPYMGSGTTLRAAKDLNRKAIGIELEEKYCEIAAKRMSQSVLDFGSKPVKSEQTQLIIK